MDHERIVEKIAEAMEQTFSYFEGYCPTTEYSVLYIPAKDETWFIPIFFPDKVLMKEYIRNGICYEMLIYFLAELKKVEEVPDISMSISFEVGNSPQNTNEYKMLYEHLLAKTKAKLSRSADPDPKICVTCGHDFDEHQMLFKDTEGGLDMTTKGWIACPEEDCNCLQTWGVNS